MPLTSNHQGGREFVTTPPFNPREMRGREKEGCGGGWTRTLRVYDSQVTDWPDSKLLQGAQAASVEPIDRTSDTSADVATNLSYEFHCTLLAGRPIGTS